jgi:hypothetical protein
MTTSITFGAGASGGSAGQKQSLLDIMQLTVLDSTYFVGNMSESMKPNNPTHLYNQDTLAKSAVDNFTIVEGSAISLSAVSELVQATNWVAEFGVAYSISDIMAETKYGGVGDRVAYETKKALKRIGMAIESAIVLSTGYSGTSAAGRKMKGLALHCTATTGVTGAGTSGTAFSTTASGQSKIDDVLVLMKQNGVTPNVMVISPANSVYMSQWTDYGTRTSKTEATERGTKVVKYMTNFGSLTLVISTYQPDTMAGLIDENEFYLNWMIKPITEKVARVNYATDFSVHAAATNEARVAAAFGNVTLS